MFPDMQKHCRGNEIGNSLGQYAQGVGKWLLQYGEFPMIGFYQTGMGKRFYGRKKEATDEGIDHTEGS
jgi:hypothetical protein